MLEGLLNALPLLIGLLLLLGIVLWDMEKVRDLSHIIHDDHSDVWKPMSTRDMYDWYSDADLCAFKMPISASLESTMKRYRLRNCTATNKLPSLVFSNKLICAVGMNLGRSCDAPLPSDAFYLHKLKDKNMGHPFNYYLNKAVARLAQQNIPIVMIGDAVSKQNEESLICESIRTNKKGPISISGVLDLSMKLDISNITLTWTKSQSKLHIYFLKAFQLRSSKLEQLEKYIERLLQSFRNIVIVANIGTWYTSREKFRADIEPLLKYLHHIGKHNLVLFRETSTQHWNYTSHGYFPQGSSKLEGSCIPLEDASPDLDWKNRDVKNFIANENLHNVHIIPFRDITAPLHNMHFKNDCSQFCYFPQLWQGVYYHLDDYSSKKVFGSVAHDMTNTSHQLHNITAITNSSDKLKLRPR